ncbi:hypothetical protein R5R49_03980 [Oenococcus oeni]
MIVPFNNNENASSPNKHEYVQVRFNNLNEPEVFVDGIKKKSNTLVTNTIVTKLLVNPDGLILNTLITVKLKRYTKIIQKGLNECQQYEHVDTQIVIT